MPALGVALAAALVAGGASIASGHGGDTDQVHACVGANGSMVRIVDADETCPVGHTALDWNIEGPAGPAGPPGEPGPPGSGGAVACVPDPLEPSTGDGVEAFARLEGIKGDSRNVDHADEVELVSVRVGVAQPSSNPCSPSALQIDHLVLAANIGRASVPLIDRATTRSVTPEVAITLDRTGGRGELLRYELKDVVVAGTRTAWAGGVPIEEITLSFSRITWTFTPQNPDGTLDTPISFCWDVTAAAECG